MQHISVTIIFISLALYLSAIALSRWHKLVVELREEHVRNRAKRASVQTGPIFKSLQEKAAYEEAWRHWSK